MNDQPMPDAEAILVAIRQGIENSMPSSGSIIEAIDYATWRSWPVDDYIIDAIERGTKAAVGEYLASGGRIHKSIS